MELVDVFDVICLMCGRTAGQIRGKVFVATKGVGAPRRTARGARCSECGGTLYVDLGESIARVAVGVPRDGGETPDREAAAV